MADARSADDATLPSLLALCLAHPRRAFSARIPAQQRTLHLAFLHYFAKAAPSPATPSPLPLGRSCCSMPRGAEFSVLCTRARLLRLSGTIISSSRWASAWFFFTFNADEPVFGLCGLVKAARPRYYCIRLVICFRIINCLAVVSIQQMIRRLLTRRCLINLDKHTRSE
ncbi:hypothetical protein HYPSUDRAFT_1026309 [Hypholoma sublateritium FD-334 SS-4]|uniref:Uncharacterized protein n=1 Tax=Hypholoma sublateritium (strain FD-334 SS-4) TaxID=945553 RepID=A0A0D2M2B3_HYPSF|nr:hypothetical protein HYPSUDRAFT_1026309 [Hypholoma sublateritium FD-334 SS-4]